MNARESMSWSRGGLHNLSVGTAFVLHNMTSAIALAFGQLGSAMFISSPRYVNWLTRSSLTVAKSPKAWAGQLELLGLIAARDKSETGRMIVKRLSDANERRRLSGLDLGSAPAMASEGASRSTMD
jgi:hypothetical protein